MTPTRRATGRIVPVVPGVGKGQPTGRVNPDSVDRPGDWGRLRSLSAAVRHPES